METFAQPWVDPVRQPPTHRVSLAFAIHASVAIPAPHLALEDADRLTVLLDGKPVSGAVTGWFVDEAIHTLALPDLSVGEHELVVVMPYDQHTNLEWCYLLGDFGVRVQGRHARLIEPVRVLDFGDWTQQGLPFYAGNVTYHCTLEGQGCEMAVRIPAFKAPLLAVALNGQKLGPIAFAPFQRELGDLPEGSATLDITAYGNRVNAFGALHNAADPRTVWFGPEAWRSEGEAWSYTYQLKPMGLLTAPQILRLA